LFEAFTDSDFKNLDSVKTFSDGEIVLIKKNLRDLGSILIDKIKAKWGVEFRARLGKNSGPSIINELLIILTAEPDNAYLIYPRFVLKFTKNGIQLAYLLRGYENLDPGYSTSKSKKFYENMFKNADDCRDYLERYNIDISNLDFRSGEFDSSDYINLSNESGKIVDMDENELVDLIISDLKKLAPLYNITVKGILDTIDLDDAVMYSLEDCNLLLKKKQIILYGPPGTGKTFKTKEYAVSIISG
jgi:hypothetical protein